MLVLGKISGPYGIRGWVRVHPFGDDPIAWAKMPIWWLSYAENEAWRPVQLKTCRQHSNGLVCQFEGIDDCTTAETLKGMLVGAPREALPVTQENEYYWADLIGLEVINTAGESLGLVEGLIETGANNVLSVVSKEGTERLLPFVATVVLAIEQEKSSIRVNWCSDW